MRLIADYLTEMAEYFFEIPPEKVIMRKEIPYDPISIAGIGSNLTVPMNYESYGDLAALFSVADKCETIILPTPLVRQFIIMARAKRVLLTNEWLLPFDHMLIQFTEPIDEKDFFPNAKSLDKDNVEALVLCRDKWEDSTFLNTVIAWYMPTHSVNRVAWWDDGRYNINGWLEVGESKVILRGIATAIAMFLTAKNIDLVRKEPSEKINRKRRKRGKRILPAYYETIIHIAGGSALNRGVESGLHHSYMYPVRGHFRHFRDGSRTWIVPHYRGLEHAGDSIPKHAYRVKEDQ